MYFSIYSKVLKTSQSTNHLRISRKYLFNILFYYKKPARNLKNPLSNRFGSLIRHPLPKRYVYHKKIKPTKLIIQIHKSFHFFCYFLPCLNVIHLSSRYLIQQGSTYILKHSSSICLSFFQYIPLFILSF